MIEHFSILQTNRDVPYTAFDPLGFVRQYLHNVLNTQYMYVFSTFNIVFIVIAISVSYVIDNFFPQARDFAGFIYLLDAITFLPGFVYMNFLSQVLNGYTNGIRSYLDYLQRVERIAMHCKDIHIDAVYPVLLVLVDLGRQFRGDQLPEYFELMSRTDPTTEIKEHIKNMNFSY